MRAVGEPGADRTRLQILGSLIDGTAHTARELASAAGVTPANAGQVLARLTGAGTLEILKQGPHRYYRIASSRSTGAIRAQLTAAEAGDPRPLRSGPNDPAQRHARVCYDHLAGEAAVRLLRRLRAVGVIEGDDDALSLTETGEAWCVGLGIDSGALQTSRRALCRACLDWSERRTHLAGAIGAALFHRLVATHLARRVPNTRTVLLSPAGEAFIEHLRLPE